MTGHPPAGCAPEDTIYFTVFVGLNGRNTGKRTDRRDRGCRALNVDRRLIRPLSDRADRTRDDVEVRQRERGSDEALWAHAVLLDEDDAGHAGAAVHGALAGRPEHEVGRRRRLALDVVADALHDRGQALGGEGARDGDIAFGNPEQRLRGSDRVLEPCAIVSPRVLMEALELSRRLDPPPELVVDR